jgi:hypothetical protein
VPNISYFLCFVGGNCIVGMATCYGPAWGVAFTTHPSSAEVKESVYLYSPLQALNVCCTVKFFFYFYFLSVKLDGPGLKSWYGQNIFLFSKTSRPALELTQSFL